MTLDLPALGYAAAMVLILAACWFGGPYLERLVLAGPPVLRRLAYFTLALAMVRGLLRFLVP